MIHYFYFSWRSTLSDEKRHKCRRSYTIQCRSRTTHRKCRTYEIRFTECSIFAGRNRVAFTFHLIKTVDDDYLSARKFTIGAGDRSSIAEADMKRGGTRYQLAAAGKATRSRSILSLPLPLPRAANLLKAMNFYHTRGVTWLFTK